MNHAAPAAPAPRAALLPRLSFLRLSLLAAIVLCCASWVYILNVDSNQSHSFFSAETWRRGVSFLKDLAGAGSTATPAFAQASAWRETGRLAYQTLAMAVLGIGIAALVALATFIFGARTLMTGELAPYGASAWRALYIAARAFFTLTRSVPELVWAMIAVFIFSPGILPGAIALGIHNAGILGKLSSEVVEGLDPRPMRALRSSGAGRFQVLLYGVLPEALPRFTTYLLYRWEVIIRTTIVVGFVAAGGLGQEFRLAMSHFHYTTLSLILIWYLILVAAVDIAAVLLRRLAR
ncbi:MAG: ABC transporter permease subunit [Dehalococcoidia bacterium]|nr:ABC transporter permease subunit [Dehalococcoidia bacterium]